MVLASVVVLALLLGVWMLLNWLRRRRLLAPPHRIGAIGIAVFPLVPSALPLLFGGDPGGAVVTFGTLLAILLVVYAVTSYGLVSL